MPETPAPSRLTKLRLVLDVSYEHNDEPEENLRFRLDNMIRRAVGDGLLTGDSPAEVEEWKHRIESELKVEDFCVSDRQRDIDFAAHVVRFLEVSDTKSIASRLLLALIAENRGEAIRRMVNIISANPDHVLDATLKDAEWAYGRTLLPKA